MIFSSLTNIGELSSKFKRELKEQYSLPELQNFLYLIFQNLMELSKTDIHINPGKEIPDHFMIKINEIINELKEYKPIQYILGETEFYGCDIKIDQNTLIPRPETEELVRWILDETDGDRCKIIDIGTGSGCIAVALAKNNISAKVFASDNSEEALKVARENAGINNTDITFFHFNINLPETSEILGLYDLIVSNPPYVTESEKRQMKKNVLKYEPHDALFVPDSNPLIFFRAILEFAESKLQPGGNIFFEINERFGKQMIQLLEKFNYHHIILRKDINNKDRMIKGTKK
ncbi:MAG: peptide chain release factor N(5)-glutamine methyltransferase [Bacteroidales bacterium]|nr:peptide chain release factor N(5)-glutamine methyltransferase [Bacteroidales bacterium]